MMRSSSKSQISEADSEEFSSLEAFTEPAAPPQSSYCNSVFMLFVCEAVISIFLSMCITAAVFFAPDTMVMLTPFGLIQIVPFGVATYLAVMYPKRTIFSRSFFLAIHGISSIVEIVLAIAILSIDRVEWTAQSNAFQHMKNSRQNQLISSVVLLVHATIQTILGLAIHLKIIYDFYPKKDDPVEPNRVTCSHPKETPTSKSSFYTTELSNSTKASTLSSGSFCHHAPSLMNCDCKKTTTSLAALSSKTKPAEKTPSAVYVMPQAPSRWTVLSEDYYSSQKDTHSLKSSRIGGGAEVRILPAIPDESVYVDVDLR